MMENDDDADHGGEDYAILIKKTGIWNDMYHGGWGVTRILCELPDTSTEK